MLKPAHPHSLSLNRRFLMKLISTWTIEMMKEYRAGNSRFLGNEWGLQLAMLMAYVPFVWEYIFVARKLYGLLIQIVHMSTMKIVYLRGLSEGANNVHVVGSNSW